MTCVAMVIKAQLVHGKTLHSMIHDRLTKKACRLSNQKAVTVSVRVLHHPQHLPQKAVISAQRCLLLLRQGCALF
jgi:hypothetical protein